jgi:hypothetical protein
LITACSCLFLHVLQASWPLHARLNLLLQGYVFYHLESPNRSNYGYISHSQGFVSKLVYNHGAYVGYLDPYGNFRSLSETGTLDSLNRRIMTTTMVLFYLEWGFFFISVVIAANLLWSFYRERRYSRQQPIV